jgi:hypothetical protein
MWGVVPIRQEAVAFGDTTKPKDLGEVNSLSDSLFG